MSLLEYGAAGLPSVATEVGQCSDVLDHGEAGILVKPGAPGELAQALISLLQSPGRRRVLAERFHRRVNDVYSSEKVADKVCNIYDTVPGRRSHNFSLADDVLKSDTPSKRHV